MKWGFRLIVLLLVAAAAAATVEVFHPDGLAGAWTQWTSGHSNGGGHPAAAAAGEGAPAGPAEPPPRGPGAAAILSSADTFYDRGQFEDAAISYRSGVLLAADAAEKDRALRGARKAVLAWALVVDSPRVSAPSKDAESEFARRLAEVESSATGEKEWLGLIRYAEGARLRQRLAYLAERTLEAATPGGVVHGQLEAATLVAGNKARDLAAAMGARGFRPPPLPSSLPPESGRAAESGRTEPRPPAQEGSGIGGVGVRGVPLGSFSSAMRERLREAGRHHRDGEVEYGFAGPDGKNRAEHRRRALASLQKAREIYIEAQGEDGRSSDLDERIKEVTLMIKQLKSDAGIGER